MTTTINYTESNKKIALFMGAKYLEQFDVFEFHSFQESPVIDNIRFRYLKYHTSWDWLMPVVEKIGDMRVSHQFSNDSLITVTINSGHVKIEGAAQRIFYCVSQCGSAISATYSAIVQFIEWYNQNK